MYPMLISRRTAAVAVAALLFAGCDRDTPVTPDATLDGSGDLIVGGLTAGSVANNLTLRVGQQLTLRPADSRVLRRPSWTSSNPAVASVNSQGVVTALSSGEALIAVTALATNMTYQVDVQSTPAIATIAIAPKTGLVLASGQPLLFTSTVSWSDRAIHAATVTYSATGGTISSNGLFTAGQLAGAFMVVATCSCGQADTATGTVARLSLLSISPKTSIVAAGSTQQFTTSVLLSNGTTLSSNGATWLPDITYSATAGTVSGTGQYTAPTTPGTYRVIVAQVGGALRDTATVTVPAPQLTALTIAPKTVSLASGATQQFVASANWNTGATTLPPVTYSVEGGGTVSASGLFTAPATGGVSRVIVAHTGGTLRDTATIQVIAPPPTLTSLAISPKTASLASGQTQQFVASANWSTGATTLPPVTYSVTGGGTVSASGLFTAPATAGVSRVIVAHTGGTLRDTATIVVTASIATLSSLTISPKTTSLTTGQTQQFSVSAIWSNGSTTVPPISYSVVGSGGSITAAGVYTAPTAAGTYRVVVSQVGGGRQDTAVVVVTASNESNTLASFTPNRPGGLSLVTDTRFANMREWPDLSGDGLAYSWSSRLATDRSAPFGPTVYETFYPGNDAGNGAGGGLLMGEGGHSWRQVYFSMMIWLPSDYSIHSNGEKFFYPIITTPGQPQQTAFVEWRPIGTDTPNGPTFGLHLITYPTLSGGTRYAPPVTPARITKGRWTRIEVYCAMNSVGRKDGVWRAWIDGQLAVDLSNVMWSEATVQSYFDRIRFTGTRGGGASTTLTPPDGQVRRYNRLAFFASQN